MTTERRELVARIWARDPTVWTGKDEARWLGWLDEPFRMREDVDSLLRLATQAAAGCDAVVLFGMGGSSLAPEVLRRSFGSQVFQVVDTTHPQAIRDLQSQLDLERTLFVTASKSGSTLETRSHTDYFWRLVPRGERWVAITDPGSELAVVAQQRKFGAVFSGEPTIGGRYSALSPFGLVPAALLGVDVAGLLDRACEMADACRLDEGNPGLELGLALGEGWQQGRDKVCLPNPNGFGLWAEQLIAESTGKQGKGLIPAPGEPGDGPDRQVHDVRLPEPLVLGL
jgi:transaldolase/glucose-6-phosphate isomerase